MIPILTIELPLPGFQSIGDPSEWCRHCLSISEQIQFLLPINRCHQRVVTMEWVGSSNQNEHTGFQSLGVTSEWCLYRSVPIQNIGRGFQSIGVTSEW